MTLRHNLIAATMNRRLRLMERTHHSDSGEVPQGKGMYHEASHNLLRFARKHPSHNGSLVYLNSCVNLVEAPSAG